MRGVELLVEHVQALEGLAGRRPPLERLSEQIGVRMASLLVNALAGDHGMRRPEFVA